MAGLVPFKRTYIVTLMAAGVLHFHLAACCTSPVAARRVAVGLGEIKTNDIPGQVHFRNTLRLIRVIGIALMIRCMNSANL
jgi:hypothetical protein